MGRVTVAFVWHFHQPCYLDPGGNRFVMPWVRFHGVKDYYGMAALLREFPSVRCTVNFSPVLLSQIAAYVSKSATDLHREIAQRDPSALTDDEKHFIRKYFLNVHPRVMRMYPRYGDLRQLLEQGEHLTKEDFMDLQVLSNLVWFHPIVFEKFEDLRDLQRKGRNFTAADREVVFRRQDEIISEIIPAWKELQDRGQVEISLSPYYHPILPLLCNVESAREAMPHIKLPVLDAGFRDDARRQVADGVAYYREVFGRPPKGMWPSEGSVSRDIVPLLADAGIEWCATDQEILAASMGQNGDSQWKETCLYKPYRVEHEGKSLTVVFRDTELSNLIGFTYSSYDPHAGARDFMERLRAIRNRSREDILVSVILDGENPWEHYEGNGVEFLRTLYTLLGNEEGITTARVSDYLQGTPPTAKLERLFAGSWIDRDFHVWIGHEEDRKGWEMLDRARLALREAEASGLCASGILQQAWRSLYAAEGSDWFWWFGDDFSTPLELEFDALFRMHIADVYRRIGKPQPEEVFRPIKRVKEKKLYTEPWATLQVNIDGRRSDYFEWIAAGHYEVSNELAAMHESGRTLFTDIFFGFDREYFLLRLDFKKGDDYIKKLDGINVSIHFLKPRKSVVDIDRLGESGGSVDIAVGDIVEMAYPLRLLGIEGGDAVEFYVEVRENGKVPLRFPASAPIAFLMPATSATEVFWSA